MEKIVHEGQRVKFDVDGRNHIGTVKSIKIEGNMIVSCSVLTDDGTNCKLFAGDNGFNLDIIKDVDENLLSDSTIQISYSAIKDIIGEESMKKIVEDVYRKKVEEKINNIISVDDQMSVGTILNRIIKDISDRYVKKLSDKFEDQFEEICKREIYSQDLPTDDYDETFRFLIVHSLQDAFETYINKNRDEVNKLIQDRLSSAIDDLTVRKLSDILSRRIDFNDILKDVILNKDK